VETDQSVNAAETRIGKEAERLHIMHGIHSNSVRSK
jgi:hypothetical protein